MEREYRIKFSKKELDTIKILLNHEKEYFQSSEETKEEKDYIKELQDIINKIEDEVERYERKGN